MKTLATVLMISASVLVGAAQAAEPEVYPAEVGTPSSLTRAQVVSQLHAAQVAGLITEGQQPSYPVLAAHQAKTRAEVQAELAAAVNAGQVVVGQDPFYPHDVASIDTQHRG
ncbi:MAG: DUF4148 domain-containing protein [Rhodanobacter sp.]